MKTDGESVRPVEFESQPQVLDIPGIMVRAGEALYLL